MQIQGSGETVAVCTSAFQLNFKVVNTNSKISRSISDFFQIRGHAGGSNRAVHSLRSTSDLSKSFLYSTTLWPRGGGDSRVCMQTQLTILVDIWKAEDIEAQLENVHRPIAISRILTVWRNSWIYVVMNALGHSAIQNESTEKWIYRHHFHCSVLSSCQYSMISVVPKNDLDLSCL
jgi:hypothetical protein